uniref:Uncharacterized protein n=1 Tax=Plectus sambesii TaxID=2011161 RepID=A0A914XP88_9BILA
MSSALRKSSLAFPWDVVSMSIGWGGGMRTNEPVNGMLCACEATAREQTAPRARGDDEHDDNEDEATAEWVDARESLLPSPTTASVTNDRRGDLHPCTPEC